jgi:hypothetical protein
LSTLYALAEVGSALLIAYSCPCPILCDCLLLVEVTFASYACCVGYSSFAFVPFPNLICSPLKKLYCFHSISAFWRELAGDLYGPWKSAHVECESPLLTGLAVGFSMTRILYTAEQSIRTLMTAKKLIG